jgi:phage terminase large subunit
MPSSKTNEERGFHHQSSLVADVDDAKYYVLTQKRNGYRPYGAALEAWKCKEPEIMLAGAYETGKTLCALQKLHGMMFKYPNARALMVRKSYKALIPSALATYYNKVLPHPPGNKYCPVEVYGGGKPDWITYPNGSRIVLGGLDNPEKVLSSEYDVIFVPQAEELTLHDWEQLKSRNTGRAGNMPYAQMIGDCNPDVPTHWILNRKTLNVFHSRHTDNPTLFVRNSRGELELDEEGQPITTEQGHRSMTMLQSLTGVRYKRGYLGLWVGAEGLVYEDFDQQIHVVDNIEPQPHWRKFRVFDFGYNHPFVCQFWALDHDDVLYLWKEIYMTGRTVRQHVEGIRGVPGVRQLSYGHDFEVNICDWDAEDRATLEEMLNIETIAADKRISTGIEAVQNRLRVQGNNKPRIVFSRNAIQEIDGELEMRYQPTCTIEEFPAYVWRKIKEGSEQTSKDEKPVKQADHGLDATKYMVAYLDGGTQYGKPKYVRYA